MVHYVALGDVSAEAWTGIFALLLHACLVAGALGAGNALGFAGRRDALVLGQARARGGVSDYLALGVGAAG